MFFKTINRNNQRKDMYKYWSFDRTVVYWQGTTLEFFTLFFSCRTVAINGLFFSLYRTITSLKQIMWTKGPTSWRTHVWVCTPLCLTSPGLTRYREISTYHWRGCKHWPTWRLFFLHSRSYKKNTGVQICLNRRKTFFF